MKLYSDFALQNEYLIRIRAQAQAPFHIEENTYGNVFFLGGGGGGGTKQNSNRISNRISDFYEYCRQAE